MKRKLTIQTDPTRVVTVLSVSPRAEDHRSLQNIFNHSNWVMHKADGLATGIEVLQNHSVAVVLSESNLSPGTWIDLFEQTRGLPNPPLVIVTSRFADKRLWIEALNRGAYDVLPKPFDPSEVFRIISSTWLHWLDKCVAPVNAMRATAGALF